MRKKMMMNAKTTTLKIVLIGCSKSILVTLAPTKSPKATTVNKKLVTMILAMLAWGKL